MKNIRSNILIACIFGLFLLIGIFIFLARGSFQYILFGGQTKYSAKYNDKNFKKVQLGMHKKEVYLLLGHPLGIEKIEFCDRWEYYPSKNQSQNVFDVFGPFTKIDFNSNGTVSGFHGDYLGEILNGLSKAQVRDRYGLPSKTTKISSGYKLIYSQPMDSGTYKVRNIYLDETEVVVKLEKGILYD